MVTINQLYERALNDGIEIDEVFMQELRAVAFPEGWIAIDPRKFTSRREFKCELAHEIGHCETGSFYNIYSLYDLKEKCERKANKRAAEILMPIIEVRQALHKGYVEPWLLAEYFDVTQEFVEMALDIYADSLHTNTHEKRVVGMPQLMKARDLLPPESPKLVDKRLLRRDMAALQRIGLLDFDWKTDQLLNLPDYY